MRLRKIFQKNIFPKNETLQNFPKIFVLQNETKKVLAKQDLEKFSKTLSVFTLGPISSRNSGKRSGQ